MNRNLVLGLLAFVLVAWALVNWRSASVENQRLGEVPEPTEYHFECHACTHQWQTDLQEGAALFEGGMAGVLESVACVDCGKKKASLQSPCPYCRKLFLVKEKDPVCPHCNRNPLTWRRHP